MRDIFLEKSDMEKRAKGRFADPQVAQVAIDIAKRIGGFAAEDELEDAEYVEGLSDFILSVAPHKALIEAFREFARALKEDGEAPKLESLLDLFGKTRIAEMASYSQIAHERVMIVRELEKIVFSDADENKLQQLISRAPWLIEPTWTVLTKNQTLATFKRAFEEFYKKRSGGETVDLAIGMETKRPDFTLVSLGHKLHVVEIKRPDYAFGDDDAERLINYLDAFDAYFKEHTEVNKEFPDGYGITLIVDSIGGMKKSPNQRAIKAATAEKKLEHVNWTDFLSRARKAHEQFLEANDKAAKKAKKPEE